MKTQRTEIVSWMDTESPNVVCPSVFSELNYDRNLINILTTHKGVTYLLCPFKYHSMNFQNEKSYMKDRNDSSLLSLLLLIKKIFSENRVPIIIFDRLKCLIRFQQISSKIVYEELPICFVKEKNQCLKFERDDKGPKKMLNYKGHRSDFPPFPTSKKIKLFLVSDEVDAVNENNMLIYFKTETQFYESGYPRLFSSEYKIKEKVNDSKIPLIVFTDNSMSLPRIELSIKLDPIYLPVGQYNLEKLVFTSINESNYSGLLEDMNKEVIEIFSKLTNITERLYFSEYLLTVIYNLNHFIESDLDESVISRMSENVSLQNQMADFFGRLVRLLSRCNKPEPKITGWKDILELRKKIRQTNQEIKYLKELETSMQEVFNVLFRDVISFNKLFTAYNGSTDYISLKKTTEQILRKIETPVKVMVDETDFDPETAVGYIAKGQGEHVLQGIVTAKVFNMESEGKKFVFYCAKDGKIAKTLSPGETLTRNYWNYQSLKTRLLNYLEEFDTKENEEEIRKYLEDIDEFHQYLDKYVYDSTGEDFKSDFQDERSTGALKLLFRNWANETMQPAPANFSLFLKAAKKINTYYEKNFDGTSIYTKMRKIKAMRKDFSDETEKANKIYYKILGPPIDMKVGAEKIGRIYRIS